MVQVFCRIQSGGHRSAFRSCCSAACHRTRSPHSFTSFTKFSPNPQTKLQPRSCKLQNLDKTEHKQSCVMAAALKAELHSTLPAPDVALKPEP